MLSMIGDPIDLNYLADSIQKWRLVGDPLEDPTGIASKYGNQLVKIMKPEDLQNLKLFVKSAIPWIHLKNFHPVSEVTGETPQDLFPQQGDRRWWRPAYATLSVIGAIGLRVVSYTCESKGWVFAHLTPKPGS